jgi:hypothetical protein
LGFVPKLLLLPLFQLFQLQQRIYTWDGQGSYTGFGNKHRYEYTEFLRTAKLMTNT